MKRLTVVAILFSLILAGCPAPQENAPGDAAPSTNGATTDGATPETNTDGTAQADGTAEVDGAAEVAGTPIEFNASDAMIQFVGVHADPEKPDPRTGTFGEFSGQAVVTDGALTSVTVDIVTSSLTTEIDKLTTHLKSGDFFNVNEYPMANFQSKSITDAGEGKVTIDGVLTLLGETQPISFPATVSTADGFTLDASFTIDRTKFGMDYGVENVKKEVEMTVKIPK